ncbi:hypothetical protein [Methanoregula sp.]|uniref:hypothetical protein n=1 Tax=Methanoregula sp. TaxID=2052170 RepID=UPI00261691EC|nr:hypothetical protein [Methanoregula sp.]MDD5142709.1 hypothetical protein [Methanoregula sp.]
MNGMRLLLVIAALLFIALPVSAEVTLTINATPASARIGDTIILNGTVSGTTTIAVFLFLTGDGLDTRGVALDNLNIPAGRGMFTTAPVQLTDGTWTYTWDTSVILGTLKSGMYTVYVVDSPVDRLRPVMPHYATADIEFHPAAHPPEETPLHPLLPLCAVVLAMGLVLWLRKNQAL